MDYRLDRISGQRPHDDHRGDHDLVGDRIEELAKP
jgi:hypothetical protein